MRAGNGTKVVVRSRNGRTVAGACAGAAEYFGIDVTLVRVIVAVVAVITGGVGVLACLVAWVIIPDSSSNPAAAWARLSRSGFPGRWAGGSGGSGGLGLCFRVRGAVVVPGRGIGLRYRGGGQVAVARVRGQLGDRRDLGYLGRRSALDLGLGRVLVAEVRE
jgi:phage shock protein C